MRYIALLRGINVGGNTMMKMGHLKAEFDNLGFENVKTYINSGNIGFDTDQGSEAKIVADLEAAVEARFGRAVPIMVRQRSDIELILQGNPFAGQYESHKEMHVLFLKEALPQEKEQQLLDASPPGERFKAAGREIYCHLAVGTADSLLGKGFIEKKLKVSATARNWRTVEKLASL